MQYFKLAPKVLLPMVALLLMLSPAKAETVTGQRKNATLRNLPKLLRTSERVAEFEAFTSFTEEYERTAHLASIEYLNSHPELIEKIRRDLGSEEIHWNLRQLSHRLLYAPTLGEQTARLFTDYCLKAIDDMLDLTDLDNPYASISTRLEDIPGPPGEEGIRAIIVRDLAREYNARYQFSGTDKKRIEISLSGRIAVNEVGSYSSFLHYSEDKSSWEFSRNRQTIWKMTSANPYTVLMTPLEETLHIILRKHTESAITAAFDTGGEPPPIDQVRQTVEKWLAVEEAIVGGIVYHLGPEVIFKRFPDLPRKWVEEDLNSKDRYEKYRHLHKAIELIPDLGIKMSIDMYARDPETFRTLLVSAPNPEFSAKADAG